MRIRATVAVATGALALSALAIPAAQAARSDDGRSWSSEIELPAPKAPFGAGSGIKGEAGARSTAQASDIKVFGLLVNGGKPIVVGTKSKQTISYSMKVTHESGVGGAAAFIWVGKDIDKSFGFGPNAKSVSCAASSATLSHCKGTITLDPALMINSDAASWHVGVSAIANDGTELDHNSLAWAKVQRFSKLTVNASPEPVKKGKTLTVTGKLTRANWDSATYKGYATQPVKLQFKKKGAKSYTTVKTVKTSSTGTLKTTVKAAVDGYWRYSFAGTSTTPAVSAPGDYVDVKITGKS
ncbi:calcium-binding protein [Streptomyces microflavus]|uniref:Calcium-binding protein n=1 Tax=Streptomyces microflavus TaxID=1919 RepID=A0A7J0CW74_STRMI|nr:MULTISPECIES: hypothetical protein [Streptomyces]MDX2980694.1 calcium-binding protein [Streptomyces sp. NRRL_B-2249]GFN05997.1 hypothetical protein Smic_45530 [Streptomyces microflavus]GGX74287.1 hypothetical protein GCM10010298_44050 [Streptomyces microflavus]